MAAKLVTIWWRDIPTQVNAQDGRTRYQALLPRRFQQAVDAAATAAGLTHASDYVAEWRQESVPLTDATTPIEFRAAADSAANQFDLDYPRERLTAIAGNGGFDPSVP